MNRGLKSCNDSEDILISTTSPRPSPPLRGGEGDGATDLFGFRVQSAQLVSGNSLSKRGSRAGEKPAKFEALRN
jgi:hypothetical protein